jgi:tetraacyldisaccharide 4'-kinase
MGVALLHDLLSGRRSGVGPAAVRAILRAAEVPYAAAVAWRNHRYDTGRAVAHRVRAAVVSVGNLTVGGTGKTPMVAWIARRFAQRGSAVALVSRGYKQAVGGPNDEALELAQRLPDVPHVQHADRVAAAWEAIDRHGARVIVLDDGFQHRRLARDLDIVLLDASEPFGFGHLLPRGLLREPIASLARADLVVLSRSDMIEPAARDHIRGVVAEHAPRAGWIEAVHRPERLIGSDGRTEPLDHLRGRRVAALCGIGNPAGFRHTLGECGYDVAAFRELPDHFAYPPQAIEELARWAAGSGAEAVVVTHKDLVKLRAERLGGLPLWAVSIGLEITAGRAELEARLEGLMRI